MLKLPISEEILASIIHKLEDGQGLILWKFICDKFDYQNFYDNKDEVFDGTRVSIHKIPTLVIPPDSGLGEDKPNLIWHYRTEACLSPLVKLMKIRNFQFTSNDIHWLTFYANLKEEELTRCSSPPYNDKAMTVHLWGSIFAAFGMN